MWRVVVFILLVSIPFLSWARSGAREYKISGDKTRVLLFKGSKIVKEFEILKKCSDPTVGKPEIRSIKKSKYTVQVVYGKHSYAEIDLATDEIRCLGSD